MTIIDEKPDKLSDPPTAQGPPLDPPPSYGSPPVTLSGPSNTGSGSVRATNYLVVERANSSIKGTYIVNPALSVPPALLPPLEDDEIVRPNLRLYSNYSSVNVDIHLVLPPNYAGKVDRIVLDISSTHSSVVVRLHNTLSVPITLNAKSLYSSVQVFVPRSFHGIVTQKTQYGHATTSDGVSQMSRVFSEVGPTRTVFIGDVHGEGWDASGREWLGDIATLDSTYSVATISFIDEQVNVTKTLFGSGGIFPSTTLLSLFGGQTAQPS